MKAIGIQSVKSDLVLILYYGNYYGDADDISVLLPGCILAKMPLVACWSSPCPDNLGQNQAMPFFSGIADHARMRLRTALFELLLAEENN